MVLSAIRLPCPSGDNETELRRVGAERLIARPTMEDLIDAPEAFFCATR